MTPWMSFVGLSKGQPAKGEMEFVASNRNDHDWQTGGWTASGACGDQRVDSECLYGNNCNRIFTDYSSVVGCYPHQDDGTRCFNDGATCGHQLIQDFELWVKAEAAMPAATGRNPKSCAAVGQAGVSP